jgi:hypothetical protein
LGEHLKEGDYRFYANAILNGIKIGKDEGVFSVGGLNAEYFGTKMDKPLLQKIAAQTSGSYYDCENIGSIADDLKALNNYRSRETIKTLEIDIKYSVWLLALVVFLFAMEWFLRKSYGML